VIPPQNDERNPRRGPRNATLAGRLAAALAVAAFLAAGCGASEQPASPAKETDVTTTEVVTPTELVTTTEPEMPPNLGCDVVTLCAPEAEAKRRER
jgi:hypothetical protein